MSTTFRLKGNKRFVPELRSRYVFFVISRFLCSMCSMYICNQHSMPISHMAVSGYGTQRLSVMWKSDLSDKIKRYFFPSSSCVNTAIWMHHVDADWAYWEKGWRQLYKNATSCIEQVLELKSSKITKSIEIRRTRHAGYCWRSKEELIRDVLLWTPSHGRPRIGRPARTFNSSVLIQDVAWKTYPERWTIETNHEKGPGKSMLAARHEDEDLC